MRASAMNVGELARMAADKLLLRDLHSRHPWRSGFCSRFDHDLLQIFDRDSGR